MKVKCIKGYYDLQLKKSVCAGEVFEVSETRAKELSGADNKAGVPLVEIIPPTETEKVKGGRKKKVVADE